jgi:adenylate cyclase
MSASTEQRKLAAIMFTDMVGYSALAQRDDKLALELLEEHRQLLREIFPRFNGTEIKTIGDAFLIEFHSALEAAQCAIEIQRTLAKRNHDVTADRRIELKIGIHIGDVVHRGGDMYGDGVNIASRIEPLAGAGGICVSMDVERQIRNALEARFEKLAPTELKNISVPMDLFRIVLPWEQGAKAELKNAKTSVSGRSFPASRLAWIGAIVLAVVGAGWWLAHQSLRTKNTLTPRQSEAATKSIAVLPFVDLSQAKDQEYFCDGISEEILDALAKVEGLRVVARTSSFSFKGKKADVGEIAQKLNVQNVLEGSLRREGNRIRITAQLVNARDGFHIWSDTFERELQGVFAVQDEITRSIVDALKIKLAVAPPARAQQNTQAYDLYLQGLYLSNKSDEENLRKSLNLFQRALDKDPTLSRAWVGIAKAWFWLADAYVKPLEAYQAVESAAAKALELNENDADAHAYLSEAKRVLHWDWKTAERELQRAVEIDPNSATAHLMFTNHRVCSGDLEGGQMELDEAERLDPLSPITSDYQAIVFLYSDRLDDAVGAAKRTLTLDPNYNYQEPTLARIYREQGKLEDALALYLKAQQGTHEPNAGLTIAYARLGRITEAQRMLQQLIDKANRGYVAGEQIASVFVALDNRDEAFRWLNRAVDEHSGNPIATQRELRPLYSDSRFPLLLRRMGIDPTKVVGR